MKYSRRQRASWFFLLLIAAGGVCIAQPPVDQNPAGMQKYVGKYYVLYTDLPVKDARQALTRLGAMVDMYRQLVPGPVDRLGEKMPVYLYSSFSDYRRGLPSSDRLNAGRYDGLVLQAAVDGETFSLPSVWRVIQHEGWHQYSHRVLQGDSPLPLWLEEGLAEYFAAAEWKNEKMHPGKVDAGAYVYRDQAFVLQPGRLQRVWTRIRTGQFRPLTKLITMKLRDWQEQTNTLNYDQVWSFVHFLLHADKGKRRAALQAYLADVLRNPPKGSKRLVVFQKHFGKDCRRLQQKYEAWWLAQPVPDAGK